MLVTTITLLPGMSLLLLMQQSPRQFQMAANDVTQVAYSPLGLFWRGTGLSGIDEAFFFYSSRPDLQAWIC